MTPSYIKFSDERNKKYSIKTIIAEEDGRRYVIKEPIFPEGIEHIDNIVRNFSLLQKYYDNIRICPVRKEGSRLLFEYIEGKSLLSCYRECMEHNDASEYENWLINHKNYVSGNKENQCVFHCSPKSEEMFGDLAFLEGAKGIQVANFDATASNIIISNGGPVFVDYEWVCDFPIPEELAIYYGVRDSYLHLPELEGFYSFQKAMEFLGIKSNLESLQEAHIRFFKGVIEEKDGRSFAEQKALGLKGKRRIQEYVEENQRIRVEWEKCAGHWKESCDEGQRLREENQKIREEWEKCARYWKESCDEGQRLREESERAHEEWKKCLKRFEELNQKYQQLEAEYEGIINSRRWKIINLLKGGKK